jgi:hypothetical protein
MAMRIPYLARWLQLGTGYEIIRQTVQVTVPSGGPPFTISCPPDKYMISDEPWMEQSIDREFLRLGGSPVMTTLPDGRVLPTGWTGTAGLRTGGGSGTRSVDINIKCIRA